MPDLLLPPAVLYALAFVFGALWGSFLNVCIVRLPAGKSVVRPRSHCTACGAPIRAYDNIPIFSYLWLRGRCRACGASFSPRYLFIEVTTGLLSVALIHRYGLSPSYGAYFVFAAGLIVATFVDLDHFIIPNEVTYLLVPVGLAVSFVPGATVKPLDASLGALVGGGSFALIAVLYRMLRGVSGLGFGDVKLMGAIGAFVGWRALPLVLFLSAAQGLLAALLVVVWRRRSAPPASVPPSPPKLEESTEPTEVTPVSPAPSADSADDEEEGPPPGRLAMPFGPFLALGSLEVLFFGAAISRAIFGFPLT